MILYMFEIDGKKYMASAMTEVHPKSTFRFVDCKMDTFNVEVGSAKAKFVIDSHKDLKENKKELERSWGMKTILAEVRLADMTFWKLMINICGEIFYQVELKYIDEQDQKEEPVKVWFVEGNKSLRDGLKHFGIPLGVLSDDICLLYGICRRKQKENTYGTTKDI